VGVWLDGAPDWRELAGLLADAHRRTAPKRLLARLAAEAAGAAPAPAPRRRRTPPPDA
jgi:hypothetical protein